MHHRAVGLFVASLIIALAVPGTAFADHDRYEAHADGEGFLLSVPEVIDVGGGITEADLTSGPTAHARGVGFLLSDGSISEVDVNRNGVTQRDPAEGENCAGPELPDPLELADLGCSFALADTTGDNSDSEASASGAEVGVTGGDVAALVNFLLSHIPTAEFDAAVDEIESQVLDPVTLALAEGCLEVASALDPVLDPLTATAQDLIDAIEEQGGDVFAIEPEEGSVCDLLLRYVLDPPRLGDVVAALQAELTAALDNVSILDVLLAGSDSSTTETDAAVVATAEAIGMDVALPSLNLLGNLEQVLLDHVTQYLMLIEGEVGGVINFDALGMPAPSELAQDLQDAIPQELQDVLASPDPLLTVTGGQAAPTATYDRGTEEVTTSGSVAPLIVALKPALATLLGIGDQNPITVPEGGSETIAEGTPLESTFTLSACTTEEVTRDGMPGKRIHCAGLDITLLKGAIGDDPQTEAPDGGLRVAGAAATAEVAGEALPAPAEAEDPMPETGGGLAIAGLVTLAGALLLRRRN